MSNIYPVSITFKPSAIPFEEKLLQDNTQLRPLCMKNQEELVGGRSLSGICRGDAQQPECRCRALHLMYGQLQLMEDEVNCAPVFVMSMFRRFMMIYVPSVCSALALSV